MKTESLYSNAENHDQRMLNQFSDTAETSRGLNLYSWFFLLWVPSVLFL